MRQMRAGVLSCLSFGCPSVVSHRVDGLKSRYFRTHFPLIKMQWADRNMLIRLVANHRRGTSGVRRPFKTNPLVHSIVSITNGPKYGIPITIQ